MNGDTQIIVSGREESTIDTPVDPKKTEIIVNTRPKFVDQEYLTYEQVVHLAFADPPSGPNVLITVDYYNGPRDKPDGSLTKSNRVKVVEGMIFDVVSTDDS